MRSEGVKTERVRRRYQPQQGGRSKKDGRLPVISAYTHTRQAKDGISSQQRRISKALASPSGAATCPSP